MMPNYRYQPRRLAGPSYADPLHGPCTKACAEFAVPQLRAYLNQPLMTGLYGLNGLMGQAYGREGLISGSQVRVGFEYRINRDGGYDLSALHNFPNAIQTCLYPYGYFRTMTAVVSSGWINDYVTISGITEGDYLFSEDLGELVHQALAECFPFMTINKRDPVIIDAIPSQYAGDPNVAQAGGYTPQQPMTTTAPRQPMTGATQTPTSPKCPPGYYDNGWFSTNCVPVGTPKTDMTPYLMLGGVALLALVLKR